MKKILLGTTTLIGAAGLFAGAALAETPKVTIGGYARASKLATSATIRMAKYTQALAFLTPTILMPTSSRRLSVATRK